MEWPYNLPIWRRSHRAASPDGMLVACIDPACEVSMGNPTSGSLWVSQGLQLPRCNPSFVWSDDSKYLAVPQFFNWCGLFRRQRILVVDFDWQRVYASKTSAWYFQPETFAEGKLMVTINPFGSKRRVEFMMPMSLNRAFKRLRVAWPKRTK